MIKEKKKAKDRQKTNIRQDFITIETADKIKIQYRPASPFLRGASFAIDYLIFVLIVIVIILLLRYLNLFNYLGKIFNQRLFGALSFFFFMIIFFVLRWGYYIFFEALFNGKTPGKMMLRLRTIHYQGKFLDIKAIILRNFIRMFDDFSIISFGFPLSIPAIICIMVNKDYRRIGDLIADTVVIKEERLVRTPPDFSLKTSLNAPLDDKILIKKLTEEDLYILRKFLNALDSFPAEKKKNLIEKMAKAIKIKICDTEEYTNPEEYLKSVYLRHKNEY
jgi:uncharacterized RDD family membrane protein YckC